MNYLIVKDGIVDNIIVADEAFAAETGALPWYGGAEIGKAYDPPTLDKLQAATADLAETVAGIIYQMDLDKLKGGGTL